MKEGRKKKPKVAFLHAVVVVYMENCSIKSKLFPSCCAREPGGIFQRHQITAMKLSLHPFCHIPLEVPNPTEP